MKKVAKKDIIEFQKVVWGYYNTHKRDFPWRKRQTPYRIIVSEIMLQQTQAPRVVEKYNAFLKAFPTIRKLAEASNKDVLRLWSGLGYNRRALYLKKMAEVVIKEYKGKFPHTSDTLRELPGVGPYTASAVCIFAYNRPEVCIETNIRTVFLHHFFSNTRRQVGDHELIPLIAKAIDVDNPREWYAALMDYGTYLKATVSNPSRKSKHHSKQSKFKGSDREVRGKILKALLNGKQSKEALIKKIKDTRTTRILEKLCSEGMVTKINTHYLL